MAIADLLTPFYGARPLAAARHVHEDTEDVSAMKSPLKRKLQLITARRLPSTDSAETQSVNLVTNILQDARTKETTWTDEAQADYQVMVEELAGYKGWTFAFLGLGHVYAFGKKHDGASLSLRLQLADMSRQTP
jgi:hypothetical protein